MNSPYQTPDSNLKSSGLVSCPGCGKDVHSSAAACPHCGMSRRKSRYKSKVAAALFAFFLGGFGAHRFYLGQWWGIFYLVFFWLWIPGIIAFGEFIYFLVRDQEKWDDKYNEGIPAGPNDKTSGGVIAVFVIVGVFVFIAIVGILAAIALPAYQDYTIRARISEALVAANPVKTEVVNYYSKNDELPASNTDIGIDNPMYLNGNHTLTLGYEGIVIRFSEGTPGVESETMILTPVIESSGVTWSCTGGTLINKYRPSSCRQ